MIIATPIESVERDPNAYEIVDLSDFPIAPPTGEEILIVLPAEDGYTVLRCPNDQMAPRFA